MCHVDQIEKPNVFQAVTRVTQGLIDLPSPSQGGVVEGLEHAIERPRVTRQRDPVLQRFDRLVQEVEDRAATAD